MIELAVLLLFFAPLLCCYGFSVILRSVSEWRFFRRYPRSSVRRVGRWWSPIVGLAMLALGGGCAYGGIIAQQQLGATQFGWPHALGAGLLVFAGWMCITWVIGERARGRRWCPRCRYDMADTPGLTCSECGKLAKSERGLSKPRRSHWNIYLAATTAAVGGYALWVARPVMDRGPLMAVPTWVLMAGWEWLPEAWIIETVTADLDARLQARLSPEHLVTVDRRFRFAESLLKGMYQSAEARWNDRRIFLLDAAIGPDGFHWSTDELDESIDAQLASLGERHAGLIELLGVDMVAAAGEPADAFGKADRILDYEGHPYTTIQSLVYAHANAELQLSNLDPDQQMLARNQFCRRLMPETRLLAASIKITFEQLDQDMMFQLSLDAGFLVDHGLALFPDQAASPGEYRSRALMLACAISYFASDQTTGLRDQLIDWVTAEESFQRTFASTSLIALGIMTRSSLVIPDQDRERAINGLLALLSDLEAEQDSGSNGDNPDLTTAQRALAMLDVPGDVNMPISRRWLLEGKSPYPGFLSSPKADPRLVQNWAEHLSDLAYSDNQKIRLWIAERLPLRTGTDADDRVLEIIYALRKDSDDEIRDYAEYARNIRLQTIQSSLDED